MVVYGSVKFLLIVHIGNVLVMCLRNKQRYEHQRRFVMYRLAINASNCLKSDEETLSDT